MDSASVGTITRWCALNRVIGVFNNAIGQRCLLGRSGEIFEWENQYGLDARLRQASRRQAKSPRWDGF
jgi:hypothetical protein